MSNGNVTGKVVSDGGAPISDAAVSIRSGPGTESLPELPILTGPDGEFQLLGLPEGDFTIDAYHDGFEVGSASVSVGKGGAAQVQIRMKKA